MISKGYEKTVFASPMSARFTLVEPTKNASGATLVLTEETDLLQDIKRAAQIVKRVVESDDVLFLLVTRRHLGNLPVVQATRLGRDLLTLHRVTKDEMDLYFPMHGFNPYLNLLFKTRDKHVDAANCFGNLARTSRAEAVHAALHLNEFVSHLRDGGRAIEFKKFMDLFRRKCDKNTKSVRRYIDAIFRHRGARHLVLRLDLGFAMEDAWKADKPTSVTAEHAKDCLAKFQRHLRNELPVTGFVAKLEYGLKRGYHFHALIFLNGHRVQKDVLIAKVLGEHWKNVICEGQGRYWNCNAQHYPVRGIGMVDYTDAEKRVALIDHAAAYLTKTDFWMRFQPGGKTLFKGLMPLPPPRRGRPRVSR